MRRADVRLPCFDRLRRSGSKRQAEVVSARAAQGPALAGGQTDRRGPNMISHKADEGGEAGTGKTLHVCWCN